MKPYAYFPGCSLESLSESYQTSALEAAAALDVDAGGEKPGDEQLVVLTSGNMPPNPSELLGSTKMQELVTSLEEWADWVIIDTPPILAVADPVSVARWVDGVLMVSQAGESTREAAYKGVELLGKVGARVIREARRHGVILRPLGNVIVLMPPLAMR